MARNVAAQFPLDLEPQFILEAHIWAMDEVVYGDLTLSKRFVLWIFNIYRILNKGQKTTLIAQDFEEKHWQEKVWLSVSDLTPTLLKSLVSPAKIIPGKKPMAMQVLHTN